MPSSTPAPTAAQAAPAAPAAVVVSAHVPADHSMKKMFNFFHSKKDKESSMKEKVKEKHKEKEKKKETVKSIGSPEQDFSEKKGRLLEKFTKSSSYQVPTSKTPEQTRSRALSQSKPSPPSSSSPSLANPIRRAHSNIRPSPFTKENHFIGTGTDIASPRNAVVPVSLTHHSFYGSNINGNPSSRNPSTYSIANKIMTNGTTRSSDDEKKHVLPIPITDPNDMLKEGEKQPFSLLSDNYNVPEKNSGKDKRLGDGASACVILIQEKNSSKSFAFKKFLLFPGETPVDFYSRAIKEFRIAKRLSESKHIVDTLYCVKVGGSTNISRGWGFVMEYCRGGDLFSLVTRTGWKSSPTAEKWCIFKQIAIGVKFIHDHGYVHRDLKPENILIDEHGCCKITDFGVAEFAYDVDEDKFNALESYLNPDHDHLEDNDDTSEDGTEFHNGHSVKLSTSFVGSPPYVPPEVFAWSSKERAKAKERAKERENERTKIITAPYNPFKIDTWSLGMILFCLIYQNTPFNSPTHDDHAFHEYWQTYNDFSRAHHLFRANERVPGPGIEFRYGKEFQSPGASRCAWRLSDPDPTTRYTLDDLFSDSWFLGIECCQDELMHSSLHRSDSVLSTAHDNNNNVTANAGSVTSSPIVRPRSMLDSTIDTTASSSISSPIIEVSENPFLKNDLPTLAEDNDEDQTTTAAANTVGHSTPTSIKHSQIITKPFHPEPLTKKSSMCDMIPISVAPAHVAVTTPSLSSPSPTAMAANILHNNMSQSNQSISSSVMTALTANTTDEHPSTNSDHFINNNGVELNSLTMNRASSISSLSSSRSNSNNNVRSGSTGSISVVTGRRVKHHHLDVINIQKHSSIKR